ARNRAVHNNNIALSPNGTGEVSARFAVPFRPLLWPSPAVPATCLRCSDTCKAALPLINNKRLQTADRAQSPVPTVAMQFDYCFDMTILALATKAHMRTY